MEELEKIDLIRERIGVSYKEAKEALDKAGGDVVQALIMLENQEKKWDERLDAKGRELVEYIRDIIKKGNVTKVRLKKDDRIIFEIPATIGAIGVGGALLSPLLAILGVVGTVAALVNHYKLEIVRPDGKVEEHDLNFLADSDKDKEDSSK